MFKTEPIRKITTEVSRGLFKEKKKKIFRERFVTHHAYKAMKCGHGLEKR